MIVEDLDNLKSLHEHEEQLREQGIATINQDKDNLERLILIANAMNVVFRFTHDHQHRIDEELTLQLLGIRLFNTAGCSIKLALSGYMQQALALTRDILEVSFLLDYFRTTPEQISVWKTATEKQRKDQFSPVKIRMAIDQRDGLKCKKRAEAYTLLSEFASHATYSGFKLTLREGFGELGPFVDERQLTAWLQEMSLRFVPGAALFGSLFPNVSPELKVLLKNFNAQVPQWREKHFQADKAPA